MNDKYERQMKKGLLDLLVLKLLELEPKYGYQLISELKEKSNGIFLLKEGTLYPILYRLEEEGLVASQWSEAKGKRPPRKYYVITKAGEGTLVQLKQIWLQMQQAAARIMEE